MLKIISTTSLDDILTSKLFEFIYLNKYTLQIIGAYNFNQYIKRKATKNKKIHNCTFSFFGFLNINESLSK